jgi:signal transduction histidine kinase
MTRPSPHTDAAIEPVARVLETVASVVGASHAVMLSFEDDAPSGRKIASATRRRTPVDSDAYASPTALSRVVSNGVPFVVSSAATSPELSSDRYIAASRVESIACVPVVREGKVSLIAYLDDERSDVFSASYVEWIHVWANQVAASLSTARMLDRLTVAHDTLAARLAGLEQRSSGASVASELAHEVRNCLIAPRIVLQQVVELETASGASVPVANILKLQAVYELVKERVDPAELARVRESMREIVANEKLLDKAVRLAHDSVVRGLTVTKEYLELARSGHDVAHVSEVSVNGTVRSIEEELVVHAATSGVDLSFELSADVGAIRARETDVQAIVRNLVLNSFDAIAGQPGPPASRPYIRVSTHVRDGRVVLTVKDSGAGIPAENIPRIFEPFFSTKPKTGTGLGLSIVKRAVEQYGGRITVESALGQGTTIEVDFPMEGARNAHAQPDDLAKSRGAGV